MNEFSSMDEVYLGLHGITAMDKTRALQFPVRVIAEPKSIRQDPREIRRRSLCRFRGTDKRWSCAARSLLSSCCDTIQRVQATDYLSIYTPPPASCQSAVHIAAAIEIVHSDPSGENRIGNA